MDDTATVDAAEPFPFRSDRWITPGVIVAFLIVAGLLVALVVAATAWLTSIGRDPEPLVRMVASLVAAVTGIGTLLTNLANRRTTTKTERNTGLLGATVRDQLAEVRDGQARMADALWDVADALPRPVPRHAYPDTVAAQSAAPAPRGS